MTINDCLDYRRYADSLFAENENDKAKGVISHSVYIDRYYYLTGWMSCFDRLLGNFTCWHKHHVVYIDGLARLKQMCKSL